MENKPLVSIVVITYYAGSTVLETLDSIKGQSYQNIELIITDDCSTDDTIIKCQDWLQKNHDFFANTRLLTVDKNTGVCANLQRGCEVAKGEWIKVIAGDDILLPDCIKDYIQFVTDNPEAKFVTAFRRIYNETFEEHNFISEESGIGDNSIYKKSCAEQLKVGTRRLLAQGPVVFYAKEVFDSVGGYHPEYPFEDYPFQIDALEHGYKIYLLPKATVGYRVHHSICHTGQKLFNYKFKKKSRLFFEEKCFKYLTPKEIRAEKTIWLLDDFLYKINMYKSTKLSHYLYFKAIEFIRKVL